jgi:hypothetical protein
MLGSHLSTKPPSLYLPTHLSTWPLLFLLSPPSLYLITHLSTFATSSLKNNVIFYIRKIISDISRHILLYPSSWSRNKNKKEDHIFSVVIEMVPLSPSSANTSKMATSLPFLCLRHLPLIEAGKGFAYISCQGDGEPNDS